MNLEHLNLKYALVNIGYLLLVCGTLGYAYNFLSQSGFDDATTGMVITAISLLGVFAGPAAGALVDSSERITQKLFISITMVVTIVLSAVLTLLPNGSPIIIPVVIIAFMSASVGMPLLNGMAFIYEREGGIINYGLCRGLGSAAYAVGSNIVGRLWSAFGKGALPVYIIVAAMLTLGAISLMPNVSNDYDDGADVEQTGESISMLQFFGKYRNVMLIVAALILMYFCHFIINTFMAKVIGMFVDTGIETIQGNALFIAAILELPVMFGFSYLLKRFDVDTIVIVASILYSLKHVLTFLSVNVPMFYAAMSLQMVSYAALVPAIVYLANEYVDEEDRNKGQAVFAAGTSIGGLLASFLGGWLFSLLPTRAVLGFGAAVSVCGTLLMIFALRQARAHKEA